MKIVILNFSTGDTTPSIQTEILPRIGDTLGNMPVDDYGSYPEVKGVLLFPTVEVVKEMLGREHDVVVDVLVVCEDASE